MQLVHRVRISETQKICQYYTWSCQLAKAILLHVPEHLSLVHTWWKGIQIAVTSFKAYVQTLLHLKSKTLLCEWQHSAGNTAVLISLETGYHKDFSKIWPTEAHNQMTWIAIDADCVVGHCLRKIWSEVHHIYGRQGKIIIFHCANIVIVGTNFCRSLPGFLASLSCCLLYIIWGPNLKFFPKDHCLVCPIIAPRELNAN